MVSHDHPDGLESIVTVLLVALVGLALLFAVLSASFGGILEAAVGSGASDGDSFASLVPIEGSLAESADSRSKAVALARSRLGLPYIWGASGPGAFDCSGLVVWVYQQLGIAVPRTADQQFAWAAPISPTELEPGDLTFYEGTYPAPYRITHVGIYAGGGVVLMATTSGDFVRAVGLSDPYWRAHFAGAGRIRPYPAPAAMRWGR